MSKKTCDMSALSLVSSRGRREYGSSGADLLEVIDILQEWRRFSPSTSFEADSERAERSSKRSSIDKVPIAPVRAR